MLKAPFEVVKGESDALPSEGALTPNRRRLLTMDIVQLDVSIGKSTSTTLMGMGSTHNFFDEGSLTRAGLSAIARPGCSPCGAPTHWG